MPRLLIGLLLMSAVLGCKPRSSELKSIDGGTSNGDFVVYLNEGVPPVVYRKVCPTALLGTPAQCPTTPSSAFRDWPEFERNLENQQVSQQDIQIINRNLTDTSTSHPVSAALLGKIDQALGVPPSATPVPTLLGGNNQIDIPAASTSNMQLAKLPVLEELKDAVDYFKPDDDKFRGKPHPAPNDRVASDSVVQSCLDNATASRVTYWNDIVFHYYCQLGTLRGCFSGGVRRRAQAGEPGYDAYKAQFDECLSSDNDFKRYFAGQDSSIDYQKRQNVFRHIMFSVYAVGGTQIFSRDDQDEVINEFYGITDAQKCADKRSGSGNYQRFNIPRIDGTDPLYREAGKHCGTVYATGRMTQPVQAVAAVATAAAASGGQAPASGQSAQAQPSSGSGTPQSSSTPATPATPGTTGTTGTSPAPATGPASSTIPTPASTTTIPVTPSPIATPPATPVVPASSPVSVASTPTAVTQPVRPPVSQPSAPSASAPPVMSSPSIPVPATPPQVVPATPPPAASTAQPAAQSSAQTFRLPVASAAQAGSLATAPANVRWRTTGPFETACVPLNPQYDVLDNKLYLKLGAGGKVYQIKYQFTYQTECQQYASNLAKNCAGGLPCFFNQCQPLDRRYDVLDNRLNRIIVTDDAVYDNPLFPGKFTYQNSCLAFKRAIESKCSGKGCLMRECQPKDERYAVLDNNLVQHYVDNDNHAGSTWSIFNKTFTYQNECLKYLKLFDKSCGPNKPCSITGCVPKNPAYEVLDNSIQTFTIDDDHKGTIKTIKSFSYQSECKADLKSSNYDNKF